MASSGLAPRVSQESCLAPCVRAIAPVPQERTESFFWEQDAGRCDLGQGLVLRSSSARDAGCDAQSQLRACVRSWSIQTRDGCAHPLSQLRFVQSFASKKRPVFVISGGIRAAFASATMRSFSSGVPIARVFGGFLEIATHAMQEDALSIPGATNVVGVTPVSRDHGPGTDAFGAAIPGNMSALNPSGAGNNSSSVLAPLDFRWVSRPPWGRDALRSTRRTRSAAARTRREENSLGGRKLS